MFGWTGRTVIIDLSDNSVTEQKTEKADVKPFLGGRGIGAKWISELVEPTADPLSPENILVFSTGPVTGSSMPMSGHFCISTKSPLTGTIFDSNVGGSFGTELKLAGFDSLIIKGKAQEPVIIQIYDEEVEILSADYLWRKNIEESTDLLEKKGKVLCIGRAGEKMVPMASMANDRIYSSGRGGAGAVAGSKNLKGLVVKGTNKIEIADTQKLEKSIDKVERLIVANPPASKGLAKYGNTMFADLLGHMGIIPGNNFKDPNFIGLGNISADSIKQNNEINKTPCKACNIGCMQAFADGRVVPDYETIWAFGPNIGNRDLEMIINLNEICKEYGMDPISCSSAITGYMELKSLNIEDIDVRKILKEIGEGESELSHGSRSYLCSKQAESISMDVKGLSIPGYDPRAMMGMALSYATANRGACHMNAFMLAPELIGKPVHLDRDTFAGKAALVKHFQDLIAVMDSFVLCPFAAFALGEVELASILNAITGMDYSAEEILRCGERIYDIERSFNIKAGFSKSDDMLPERFFAQDGIDKDEFMRSLKDYYRFREWDDQGRPNENLENLML